MTMTWDEVAELLALAAVYDQRKGDELDIKAWLAVAQIERWTPTAAKRVVVEHYSRRSDRSRIDPAAISDRIRALRGAAAESFEAPRIPDGLPNHEYPAWLRTQLASHVDERVERWAGTGEEPARALPAAPAQIRSLSELVAQAPLHVRRELAAGVNRMSGRRVGLDPDRRATAHAELRAAHRRDEQAGA